MLTLVLRIFRVIIVVVDLAREVMGMVLIKRLEQAVWIIGRLWVQGQLVGELLVQIQVKVVATSLQGLVVHRVHHHQLLLVQSCGLVYGRLLIGDLTLLFLFLFSLQAFALSILPYLLLHLHARVKWVHERRSMVVRLHLSDRELVRIAHLLGMNVLRMHHGRVLLLLLVHELVGHDWVLLL